MSPNTAINVTPHGECTGNTGGFAGVSRNNLPHRVGDSLFFRFHETGGVVYYEFTWRFFYVSDIY